LKRVAVGPVRLGELPTGAVRELTKKEIESLQKAVAQGFRERPPQKPRRESTGQKQDNIQKHRRGQEHRKGNRTIIG
jgi:23S rRNA pseudouridine2605 synthase